MLVNAIQISSNFKRKNFFSNPNNAYVYTIESQTWFTAAHAGAMFSEFSTSLRGMPSAIAPFALSSAYSGIAQSGYNPLASYTQSINAPIIIKSIVGAVAVAARVPYFIDLIQKHNLPNQHRLTKVDIFFELLMVAFFLIGYVANLLNDFNITPQIYLPTLALINVMWNFIDVLAITIPPVNTIKKITYCCRPKQSLISKVPDMKNSASVFASSPKRRHRNTNKGFRNFADENSPTEKTVNTKSCHCITHYCSYGLD